jgi:hypothetical protein
MIFLYFAINIVVGAMLIVGFCLALHIVGHFVNKICRNIFLYTPKFVLGFASLVVLSLGVLLANGVGEMFISYCAGK